MSILNLRSKDREEKSQEENLALQNIGLTREDVFNLIRDITYQYLENHVPLIISNAFWYAIVGIVVLGIVFLRVTGFI